MSKVIRRVGYLRFGRFLEPWIEKGRFERLNTSLKRAGMDISVRAYLGSAIFSSFIVGVISFLVTALFTALVLQNTDPAISTESLIIVPLLIGVFSGILCGIITYIPFYIGHE